MDHHAQFRMAVESIQIGHIQTRSQNEEYEGKNEHENPPGDLQCPRHFDTIVRNVLQCRMHGEPDGYHTTDPNDRTQNMKKDDIDEIFQIYPFKWSRI